MTFVQKPNFGSIFKNDKKEKDTQPDWRGSIALPDGTQMELAGWIKRSNGGDEYISLKLSEPREKPDFQKLSGVVPF